MTVEQVRIKKEYSYNNQLIDETVLSKLEKEIENAIKLPVERDGSRFSINLSAKDSIGLAVLVEKKVSAPYIEVIASSSTYEPVYENTKKVFNAAIEFLERLGLKEKIF